MADHRISSGRGRENGTARPTWTTVTWGFGLGSGTGSANGSASSGVAGLAVITADIEANVSGVGSV
jgi:hypothetical protein